MNIAFTLSQNVIAHLGEDFELLGETVQGVFSLKNKNDFGDYISNPMAFMYVEENMKVSKGDYLTYKNESYRVVRVAKEQSGIKKLELRCYPKEQKLETILPRG